MLKKIISLLLCFMFLSPQLTLAIEDDLAKNLDKKLKVKKYEPPKIEDTLIDANFIKNTQVKTAKKAKRVKKSENLIIYKKKNKNQSDRSTLYNFENIKKKTVKITPINYITTRDKSLKEGNIIEFETLEEVTLGKKRYPKNTKITGRIEMISMNQAYGVPASLTISGFKIEDNKIDAELYKIGANRALWVLPIGYVGAIFMFAGLLVLPVRGGHAKLHRGKTYKLIVSENMVKL